MRPLLLAALLASVPALLIGQFPAALPDDPDASAYLRMPLDQPALRLPMPRWIDVDHRRDGEHLYAYVPLAHLADLSALGLRFERLPDPGINDQAAMDLSERAPIGLWDSYPTWSGYVGMLEGYALAHPDIARLVDLGPTTNTTRPHRLYALEISDHPNLQEDEPEIYLTSTMHGDETTGYVLLLHLIDELLTRYDPTSLDPYVQRLTRLVDHAEIWITPLANPDGAYKASDATVSGASRYFTTTTGGSTSVDPNRNFADPQDGAHPDGRAYWLETQTMMAFAAEHPFALSANFHGGAEVVNLPWDTWNHVHVDTDWFLDLGEEYASAAQVNGPPGYMNDDYDGDGILGVTNGYAWYEVDGGRQDYTVWFHGGRETTIEISSVKSPASSQLPTYWDANRESFLGYLERGLEGVRGLVTDRWGAPLAAEVEVIGREADQARIFTDPDVGDYHRLLLAGSYDLRFRATGFVTREIPGVSVAAGAPTRLDVVLLRAGESEPLFADNFEVGSPCRWSSSSPLACDP